MNAAAAVAGVMVRERAARDADEWAIMRECFAEQSEVSLSWFNGPGADFVEQSRQRSNSSQRSMHLICPPFARVNGSRALAMASAAIVIGSSVHGVDSVMTSYCRIRERLVDTGDDWRIARLWVEYLWDVLVPRDPGARLELDGERLARGRVSYRMLSYVMGESGTPVDPDQPGGDRPDHLSSLIAADEAWLADDAAGSLKDRVEGAG